VHVPNWLNPWWSQTRELKSQLEADAAYDSIAAACGFLSGPIGRVLLSKSLTVFHHSLWHARRPWVVAHVAVRANEGGSVVTLRLARTWFQAAFITGFLVLALGVPIALLIWTVVSGHVAATRWWVYPAWLAQDAGIYAGCMALNTVFVRRDAARLVDTVADLVNSQRPPIND
jgi:hypothetical protein